MFLKLFKIALGVVAVVVIIITMLILVVAIPYILIWVLRYHFWVSVILFFPVGILVLTAIEKWVNSYHEV